MTDESPKAFLRRVWDALLRIFALVIFGVIHYGLEKAIPTLVPSKWDGAADILDEVSFLFFALVYLYLLWDMLKVFVPWLHAVQYPLSEKKR